MSQKYGIETSGGRNALAANRPAWVTYNDGMTVGLMHLFDDQATAQAYIDNTLTPNAPAGVTYQVVPIPNPPIGSVEMEAELKARAGIK
jgi:hypothetical protein